MPPDLLHEFWVGPWKIEPLRGAVTDPDGKAQHLEPKVMDVFVCLAEHANELVTRDELLETVWSGHAAADELLTRAISELRRALQDDRGDPKYIETVPKRGYRLIGEVRLADGSPGQSATKAQGPEIGTAAVQGSRFSRRAVATLGVVGLVAIVVLYLVFDNFVMTDTSEAEKSIAVLAFADLSPEGDHEYFSNGISEEILNLLVKVPELRVTSRSSAFSFKGQNVDVPTMAARLNVAHVLEGSVRKSGNRLRIVAQLIEVETDSHLWSETYDRELKDVFAIQDDIAAAVVDALKIELLGEQPKGAETNPKAYMLYLQGVYIWRQMGGAEAKQVETLLKRALEIDPDFAPAWVELGYVYRTVDGIDLARDAIDRALDIDPQNGRAYAALAYIEIEYNWNFKAANQHMQQAMALSPGDARVLIVASTLEKVLGRLDEAIDLQERAIAIDPVAPRAFLGLGLLYYSAHRLDEAADSSQMARSLNPSGFGSQYLRGLVLLAQGDAPAALMAIEQETIVVFRMTGTAIVQHALGDAVASDTALEELIEKYRDGAAYQVAEVYAFRGEIDNAFDWLEQAYETRDDGITNLLVDPLLADLHDDPRWEHFLVKMGLPH